MLELLAGLGIIAVPLVGCWLYWKMGCFLIEHFSK